MRGSLSAFIVLGAVALTGCARTRAHRQPSWPRHVLVAAQTWRLDLPANESFGASGLLLTPSGDLLLVNDRRPAVYRVRFHAASDSADLVRLADCFAPALLAPLLKEKQRPFDCEGIAQDEQGRIYLCDEADRWILRFDPRTQKVERLEIDWSPVENFFSRLDRNASFEGISVGRGRLYLANERNEGRIIVIDLKTLRVVDGFAVRSSGASIWEPHYSDLCWYQNALYVLMREQHVILQVDPRTHAVRAEYDFRHVELDDENAYRRLFPFVGVMEGLAVDDKNIWLVTDNNGLGRVKYPHDSRPTLIRCPRPDAR
jgi:hypothetical protein